MFIYVESMYAALHVDKQLQPAEKGLKKDSLK